MKLHYPIFITSDSAIIPDLKAVISRSNHPNLPTLLQATLTDRDQRGIPFTPPSDVDSYQSEPRDENTLLVSVTVEFEPQNRYHCFSKSLTPIFIGATGLGIVASTILRVGALETTSLFPLSDPKALFVVSAVQSALASLIEPLYVKFAAGSENLPLFAGQIDSWFFTNCRRSQTILQERKEQEIKIFEGPRSYSNWRLGARFMLKAMTLAFILNREWVNSIDSYKEINAFLDTIYSNSSLPELLNQSAGWTAIILNQFSEILLAASVYSILCNKINNWLTPSSRLNLLEQPVASDRKEEIFHYPAFLRHQGSTTFAFFPDLNIILTCEQGTSVSSQLRDALTIREINNAPFVLPSSIERYQDVPKKEYHLLALVPVSFHPKNRCRGFSKVMPLVFGVATSLGLLANSILRIGALETTPIFHVDDTHSRFALNATQVGLASITETAFIALDESTRNLPNFAAKIDSWFFNLCTQFIDLPQDNDLVPREFLQAVKKKEKAPCKKQLIMTLLKVSTALFLINRKVVDATEDILATQALVGQVTQKSLFPEWLNQLAGWIDIALTQVSEVIATASVASLAFNSIDGWQNPSEKLTLLHQENELEEIKVEENPPLAPIEMPLLSPQERRDMATYEDNVMDNPPLAPLQSPGRSTSSLFGRKNYSSSPPEHKARSSWCVVM